MKKPAANRRRPSARLRPFDVSHIRVSHPGEAVRICDWKTSPRVWAKSVAEAARKLLRTPQHLGGRECVRYHDGDGQDYLFIEAGGAR